MKKDFISYVSHELKAPLASMQETTHVLLERIPGPLTEKQQRLLELNLQSSKRLAGMIGNLLDLSRLQAGIVEYDKQEQDLSDIFRNFIQQRTPELRRRQIPLTVRAPSGAQSISCDAALIVQLLDKVLENAASTSTKDRGIAMELRFVKGYPDRMPAPLRKRVEEAAE